MCRDGSSGIAGHTGAVFQLGERVVAAGNESFKFLISLPASGAAYEEQLW